MIRPATIADAEAIAHVQTRAWWHAYQSFVDHDRLAGVTTEDRARSWRSHLAQDAATTWVWDQDGRVVGFAGIGPARDEDARGAGELYAIYVDPSAQGAGVGTRLLQVAMSALRERGHREALLWVFAANGLARAFYEGNGWRLEPGSARPLGEGWPDEVRYRIDLGTP